ncbi:MAG: glycosyltransferase, partial [Alphaproteobacteria bacterium]|nr:glycosyltransferase [Alphaproteobacteria bacterium]
RDFAFDIIDAEFFFPDGPAAIALGRAFGVPVSIKARGADIHYWGKRADTQRQVVSAGRAADGMLAVSSALKADMVALGMPEDKIAVHYTGIDRALFAPRDQKEVKAALEIAGKLIVSLGALVARKRHHIMIEAMSAIPDATLAIIGSGPEHDALAALARRLGVSDRVRLLGSLPRDQVAAWLAAADVMALAAASEGLANAWIEALASGAPVVTCNVGGAAEAIASPVAGQLVAPEPAAFVTAIREILVAPPPRAAVRACVDAFSWDANATALRDHLARLVTANRA